MLAPLAAFAFSSLGAAAVAWLPKDAVRPLIFLFVRFFGFDFLHASASAKVVNVATNLAALGYFLPNGYVIALLAVLMAVANITGSVAGTWLALKHGSAFVRQVFLLLVGVLILKFAWDTVALFY